MCTCVSGLSLLIKRVFCKGVWRKWIDINSLAPLVFARRSAEAHEEQVKDGASELIHLLGASELIIEHEGTKQIRTHSDATVFARRSAEAHKEQVKDVSVSNVLVCLHLAWLLKSERNIVCSAHWVVNNYIPQGFHPEILKWHFPLCCANMNRGALNQGKSDIQVDKFLTSIGNMSFAKSIGTWQIMDCNHYRYPQWRGLLPNILPNRILSFELGLWLGCDFNASEKCMSKTYDI